MRQTNRTAIATLALATTLAGGLCAQKTDDSFKWSGGIAAGKTLKIKNINGSVKVTGGPAGTATVSAVRSSRKSDPKSVEIRIDQDDDGATICAVWPSQQDQEGCNPRSHKGDNWDKNDVSVEFVVVVPEGVRFEGQTVNGSVNARGLTADAEVTSVTGGVTLATRGAGSAETVNGDVLLQIGASSWKGELEAKTVNGTVTVEMPTPANLDVHANTVNGDISSDFPLTLQGKMSPRSLRGTIGNGGPRLDLSTVNGAIELKKAN